MATKSVSRCSPGSRSGAQLVTNRYSRLSTLHNRSSGRNACSRLLSQGALRPGIREIVTATTSINTHIAGGAFTRLPKKQRLAKNRVVPLFSLTQSSSAKHRLILVHRLDRAQKRFVAELGRSIRRL